MKHGSTIRYLFDWYKWCIWRGKFQNELNNKWFDKIIRQDMLCFSVALTKYFYLFFVWVSFSPVLIKFDNKQVAGAAPMSSSLEI